MLEFVIKAKSGLGGDDSGFNILDVGCGYGRNIRYLCNRVDVDIDGVDINSHIVEANRADGLSCYTLDEFKKTDKMYDCLILSHIIEHFVPEDLKAFLDGYLSRLKSGGHIIIVTPVFWKGFYWDFDHIKMYHPVGIDMVFGSKNAQVQYYAQNRLELVDIWFRKTPHMVHYKRGLYVKSVASRFWTVLNLLYKMAFKFSFGWIGVTTGWMGLYKKDE